MLIYVLFIIAGLCLIVFRKPFTIFVTEFQRENFRIQSSPKDIRAGERSCVVTGLVVIAIAVYQIVKYWY